MTKCAEKVDNSLFETRPWAKLFVEYIQLLNSDFLASRELEERTGRDNFDGLGQRGVNIKMHLFFYKSIMVLCWSQGGLRK